AEQDQANVSPNYTVAAPCGQSSRPTTFTLNPCALPDGSYVLSEAASNPAGMVGYGALNGQTINVDCTPPTTSVASAPASDRWYSTAQQVTFVGSDNFSGVGQLSCNDGGHAGSSYAETVSAQGQNVVWCRAIDNASNVGNTASSTVDLDYQSPTIAFTGPSQSEWVSGSQIVTATGSESQQLSGIESVSCTVDGGAAQVAKGASEQLTIVGDGTHTISCIATTGAGVTGAAAQYTVHIDSQPPTLSFSGGPSQSAWSTTAQSVKVSATDQPGLSGVKQISCTLDGQTTTYQASTASVTVQPPGGELTCRAQDNAGNWSVPEAWNFLIDDTPPTGAFEPSTPSDPDQVTVVAADTGSGVAGGEIQIEESSGWQSLTTQFDAAAGTLTATVPDSGTLPDGTYQLRALVWDVAGNEATITDEPATDRPAAITLPLRIVTELLVGPAQARTDRCELRRELLTTRERGRHGRTRAAARLERVCKTVLVPRATAAVRLRFGQRATVHGLLQTVDGTPLPDRTIQIRAVADGWGADGRGTISTGRSGRFTYVLPAGASRMVTFSYPGDAVLRPSTATAAVAVVGRSTIAVGRDVRAGQPLRISGRLAGGFVPLSGVLVQLWYRVRGVPAGFSPFERAIATNRRGRWSIRFPVSPGARGYTYLFKAVVSRQSGWPFLTTGTRVVARHVS
ncbi:MAG: Ig-like domain repeat protein, partial [Solirubrobacteraceae bacterium]